MSTTIAVVGAGTMGSGIAQVAATNGHEVVLIDEQLSALENAQASLEKIFARLVEKGRLTQQDRGAILGRISTSANTEAAGESALVIEAIVEDLEAKRRLFRALEQIVADDCTLATNTSSLSITAIASACETPGRVVGIHFFNPAPLLPLVEVVPGLRTDRSTTARARALVDSWGKTTVVARDTPGFIVNRVARPFYGEALHILEEGIADVPTIDWAMKEVGGFRMGPFELMDLIGNDVNLAVTKGVYEALFFEPRYRPSLTQQRMVEAGLLGRKSGEGYYRYAEGAKNPGATKDAVRGQEIADRVIAMLMNEAVDAVFRNVATADDIDLAMTKGVNYPRGLLAWVDEVGASWVVDKLRALRERHGERYRVSPLLLDHAEHGTRFYG